MFKDFFHCIGDFCYAINRLCNKYSGSVTIGDSPTFQMIINTFRRQQMLVDQAAWFKLTLYLFFKTSEKLSRSDAIFEFSSTNSNISLNVSIECREMELLIPRSNANMTTHFLFFISFIGRESIDCSERGLNEYLYINEGEKCSRIWSQKFMFRTTFRTNFCKYVIWRNSGTTKFQIGQDPNPKVTWPHVTSFLDFLTHFWRRI